MPWPLAVHSQSSLDVNLKLFELLGRFALFGLWEDWARQQVVAAAGDDPPTNPAAPEAPSSVALITRRLLSFVVSNPALELPIADHGATDLGLAMLCWVNSGVGAEEIVGWLENLVGRLNFTVRTRARYPTIGRSYQDLMTEHADRSDEAFKAATAGSTLIPLLAVWATAVGRTDLTAALADLVGADLVHCNLQLWTPGEDSEEHLYINDTTHGRALTGLRVDASGENLIENIQAMVGEDPPFQRLSACAAGHYPIVLVACRHWRLPVPPDLYVGAAARSIVRTVSDDKERLEFEAEGSAAEPQVAGGEARLSAP